MSLIRPDKQLVQQQKTQLNPARVYLASLSKDARRVQESALRSIINVFSEELDLDDLHIDNFPWHKLSYAMTTALRTALADSYAPATANRYLAALRRTLEEAWRLGLMQHEEYARIADIPPIKQTKEPTGRALTDAEMVAILKICIDDGMIGIRDFAIISLLWQTGLRRSELIHLDVRDVDFNSGRIHVREGKGNKDRITYAQGSVLEALKRWRDYIGHSGTQPLFTNVRGAKSRLTDQAIYYRILKRTKQAAIEGATPHWLRYTFATNQLDAGTDIALVQKMMGHANPATTARYDRRTEGSIQDAVSRLDLPFDFED